MSIWGEIKEQGYRALRLAEYSSHTNGYQPRENYPFLDPLEQNAATIIAEFKAIAPDDYFAYHDPNLTKKDWRTFPLYFRGKKLDANCARCPETARLIQDIPGINLAAFSILDPKGRFKAHRGNPLGTMRVHMGVDVPPDCFFRVGSEVRPWVEGQCFVFDETYMHEAWNDSDRPRVVLIVDFVPDPEHWALHYRAMIAAEKARYHLLRAYYRAIGRERPAQAY